MVRSPPSAKRSCPPVPFKPEALLSTQQMARRLRTKLRQARVTIEREIGHSLTAVVSQADQHLGNPHNIVSSPLLHSAHATFRHSPWHHTHEHMALLRSGLGTRAHSYSQGDFCILYKESSAEDANTLNGVAAEAKCSSSTALHRHQSALSAATVVHSDARSHGTGPIKNPLDIPSSPPGIPLTPQMHPQDSENEIAQTILMLATPPAAHAPSLSESPCQRPLRSSIQANANKTNRRLSFSRCIHSPPRKRTRKPTESDKSKDAERVDSGKSAVLDSHPADSPQHRYPLQTPNAFATPNLSQVAALSSHHSSATGVSRTKHRLSNAPVAASTAVASSTASRTPEAQKRI
ncbi:hypothetical protein BX070DRAFT_243619 [Coemansia spiralis]|nr:hypothetical protein BX070DRAFT_243619 [Coemansia spiralis]